MTYLIRYDSGDGLVNSCECTLKVAETGATIGSEPCIHTVTVIEPYPQRQFNAIILGTAKARVGTVETWRSEHDLRVIHSEGMLVDAPLVNTLMTRSTYSGYDGYTGWPYSVGDSWTYEVHSDPDTFLQAPWTDSHRAEVVADDVCVSIGDAEYECFKVVHTLVGSTLSTHSGAGIGSTFVEYWPKDCRAFAPIKMENYVSYIGTETWTLVDADPMCSPTPAPTPAAASPPLTPVELMTAVWRH
jgi:hypothetical protein